MKKPTYVEVVVKVPKIKYEAIINRNTEWDEWTLETIRNGILLPKEHGDLIDRDELVYDCSFNKYGCDNICHCNGCSYNIIRESDINKAPIIVKSDKGE